MNAELIKQIESAINDEDMGYEMGCLISSEFTPAPDYKSVKKIIDDSGHDIDQIIDYLHEESFKQFESMANEVYFEHDPENGEISPAGKTIYYKDLDRSYTPAGVLAMELIMIKNH